MTFDRIHGYVVFECNGPHCHESFEPGVRDFDSAISLLREAGWMSDRNHNEWSHYCPDCKSRKPDMRKLLP